MSLSDAIGQIDRIVGWEQQLADPAALTQSPSAGGAAITGATAAITGATTGVTGATTAITGAPTGTTGANSSSFATALAQAEAQGSADAISTTAPTATAASSLLGGGDSQLLAALSSSGLTGTTSTTATGSAAATTSATATSSSDPRIQAMIQEADSLVGKPYVWGGGHDGWGPQTGYDCSGFVSAVLHAGGYLSSPQDTTSLPSAPGIESGPGQYVTIYDRDRPGDAGHVIVEIDGQFYESGGEHGSWGGGGGVAKIATPSASYLATFDRVLHPAGL